MLSLLVSDAPREPKWSQHDNNNTILIQKWTCSVYSTWFYGALKTHATFTMLSSHTSGTAIRSKFGFGVLPVLYFLSLNCPKNNEFTIKQNLTSTRFFWANADTDISKYKNQILIYTMIGTKTQASYWHCNGDILSDSQSTVCGSLLLFWNAV